MQILINYRIKDLANRFNLKKSDYQIMTDPFFTSKQDEIMKRNQQLLKTNLLHLEFITKFESYLDAKNSDSFSLDFLQELDRVKRDVQIRTLDVSEKLRHEIAIAN